MPTASPRLPQQDFWLKLNRFAYKAGREIIEKALWLFYAAKRPETPMWARSVIVGALAYFILPTDAVPDFIPGAGYADDLSVLATAVGAVMLFINDEVKQKSEQALQKWFPKPATLPTAADLPAVPSRSLN